MRWQKESGYDDALNSLAQTFNGGDDTSLVPVWRWNDAPERTLDDVLALYDRAIELAKAGAPA